MTKMKKFVNFMSVLIILGALLLWLDNQDSSAIFYALVAIWSMMLLGEQEA